MCAATSSSCDESTLREEVCCLQLRLLPLLEPKLTPTLLCCGGRSKTLVYSSETLYTSERNAGEERGGRRRERGCQVATQSVRKRASQLSCNKGRRELVHAQSGCLSAGLSPHELCEGERERGVSREQEEDEARADRGRTAS